MQRHKDFRTGLTHQKTYKIAVILREPKRLKNPVALPGANKQLWRVSAIPRDCPAFARGCLASLGSSSRSGSLRMTRDEGFKMSRHCLVVSASVKTWQALENLIRAIRAIRG